MAGKAVGETGGAGVEEWEALSLCFDIGVKVVGDIPPTTQK